jgi:hypothetical protein
MNARQKEIENIRADSGGKATVLNLPIVKRRRGRPKGSPNKVSRDAKALLANHAPPAIRALCKIAAGTPVKVAGPNGTRRVLVPDVDQMLVAARIVADRLIPALKATEVGGQTSTPSPLDGLTGEELSQLLRITEQAIELAEETTAKASA